MIATACYTTQRYVMTSARHKLRHEVINEKMLTRIVKIRFTAGVVGRLATQEDHFGQMF